MTCMVTVQIPTEPKSILCGRKKRTLEGKKSK